MADIVVVGVDGSEAGRRAAQFALRHVREGSGRLVVAYVIPWSPYTVQTAEENERRHVAKQQEVEQARGRVLDPLLAELTADPTAKGVQVEGVVRHGHPAESLCDLGLELGASHIVVGRLGESRVRSMLFGSTAGNLIQIATVPVTVVP